jgi:trans-aconitate methyltransferase
MSTSADDWDQHWLDFSAVSESAPATKYRSHLAFQLLDVDASDPTVRMLEIGSGTGKFAEDFCARYPQSKFLGIELSRMGVEMSVRRVPSAQFIKRDLRLPSEPGQVFDFQATHALCSEVLEHVDEPDVLLRNAMAYMGPNCRLVVTVPGGRRNKFDEYIGHRRHYAPEELKKLLEKAGFQVERVYGAGFPFFNLYRLLTTLRGERLIQEVSGSPSSIVRIGTLVFDVLFRFNLLHKWGWQTLAVAHRPGGW